MKCKNCVFWCTTSHFCFMIRQLLGLFEDIKTPPDFGCIKFKTKESKDD